MAHDKNESNSASSIPANRASLTEKMTKMRDGIRLHHSTIHAEEKGADTEVDEAIHDGKVIGRFVSKDGKLVESAGSADSQQSGTHDEIAKKLGFGGKTIHTAPEAVSIVAHDNMPKPIANDKAHNAQKVTKPTGGDKLNNNIEPDDAKLVPGKHKNEGGMEPTGLEKAMPGIKYGAGDNSLSYDRGGAPRAPHMTKADDPATPAKPSTTPPAPSAPAAAPAPAPVKPSTTPPAPAKPKEKVLDYRKLNTPVVNKWKEKSEAYRNERAKDLPGSFKTQKGVWMIKSETLAKWNAIRDSMKAFKDPLSKSVTSLEEHRARLKALREQKARTQDEKIDDAMDIQERKQARAGGAKRIPSPVDEHGKTKSHVLPPETLTNKLPEKAEKSTVVGAAAKPTQTAAKTPTIKNAVETTIGTKPVVRCEGLAKEKAVKPVVVPPVNVSIKDLPSAETGLENHLASLNEHFKANKKELEAAVDKTKYSGIPSGDRDKKISIANRALQYLSNGIHLTKVAIQSRDSKNPNWKDMLGTGNPKVNQLGTITLANTLPGHCCPGRGSCGSGGCYGMNGKQNMGAPVELRARNTGLVNRADFVPKMIETIKNAPTKMTVELDPEMYEHNKNDPQFKSVLLSKPIKFLKKIGDKQIPMIRFQVKSGGSFRWHDTGDIINQKHANDMFDIMKAFPDKKFYAYSKSHHLDLSKLRSLPNFHLIQSVGGKHDDKIDQSQAHTRYFPDEESAANAGYNSVYWSDSPSLSGMKKIALIPHGAGKNKLNIEEENAKLDKSDKVSTLPDWMKWDQPDANTQERAMGLAGKMRALSMHMGAGLNKAEVLSKPPVSQSQRGAMFAAASGHSTLGIPKKVGKEFTQADKGGKLPEKLGKGDVIDFKTKKVIAKDPESAGRPVAPTTPEVGTTTNTQKFNAPRSTNQKINDALSAQAAQGSPYAETRANNSVTSKLGKNPVPTKHPEPQSRESRVKDSLARIDKLSNELKNKKVDSLPPVPGKPLGPTGMLKLAREIDKVSKRKGKMQKTEDKLPGGEADANSFGNMTISEKFATLHGSMLEEKEHGPKAPTEIASDHVVESGPEYYDTKKGLPNMEKKLNKAAKPATASEFEHGMPPAYGTVQNLDPHEALSMCHRHHKMAMKYAAEGNKESAKYHHEHASLYWNHHRQMNKSEPMKKGAWDNVKNAFGSDTPPPPPPPPPPADSTGAGPKLDQSKVAAFQAGFNKSKEIKEDKLKKCATDASKMLTMLKKAKSITEETPDHKTKTFMKG